MKSQRIRDPLHNLVEFGTDQFEHTLWQVLQTAPFQRLRRIRQLGFSELVFPGATHSRFAHSVGVFHTARKLMKVIESYIMGGHAAQFRQHQAQVAIAASLVHDVGHGMFSHAFEEIGKKLNLAMAHHEAVRDKLIRDSQLSGVFSELGSGFAADVADVISGGAPGSLYDAVVSSQFDADRLDYMQRDRLMTGVQSSGIDATWLLANLEVASVPSSADEQKSESVETLVLGPKAFHAAENYVLALFQLYPNVYLHKTTRSAEKIFSMLMLHLIPLVQDGSAEKTGLPPNHPIVRFAADPMSLGNALALDDSVFWGALGLMSDARDLRISDCARRLRERQLPKCIDIRRQIEDQLPLGRGASAEERADRDANVRLRCKGVAEKLEALASERRIGDPPLLVDQSRRAPYKKFQDSKSLLNQILIRQTGGQVVDMAHLSSVVASAEAFEVCRVYAAKDDTDTISEVQNIIGT